MPSIRTTGSKSSGRPFRKRDSARQPASPSRRMTSSARSLVSSCLVVVAMLFQKATSLLGCALLVVTAQIPIENQVQEMILHALDPAAGGAPGHGHELVAVERADDLLRTLLGDEIFAALREPVQAAQVGADAARVGAGDVRSGQAPQRVQRLNTNGMDVPAHCPLRPFVGIGG